MLNLRSNTTFYEFVKNLEERLGFVIDESTFDLKFLRAMYDKETFFEDKVTQHLSENTFENLSGYRLDNFLKFFNTNRIKGGSDDLYEFNIHNASDKSFIIDKNSKILFENNYYETVSETVVTKGENTIRTVVSTPQMNEYPIFSKDGVLMFDKRDITNNEIDVLETYMPKYIKLVSVNHLPSETESDYEYLERAKAVMQTLGYTNHKKITLELLKDERVKNVSIKEIDGFSFITIIPKNISEIKEVLEYAKEVVDYYKSEHIEVSGPSLVEIYVDNLDHQLVFLAEYETILKEIIISIETYLSSIINDEVTKIGIINCITRILDNYGVSKNVNISTIEVSYRFYNKNNFEEPIVENSIITSKPISGNSVISFGSIR